MLIDTQPLFSILHASARPEKCFEIYAAWMRTASKPEDVEYVLCVDNRWGFDAIGDQLEQWEKSRLTIAGKRLNRLFWNQGRKCYVDSVNNAALASNGKILVVNADDQYPMHHWDSALWQAIISADGVEQAHQKYVSSRGMQEWEFVVEVSTGTPDEHDRGGNPIIVMPVLSRARYNRLGYVFFPDYISMYADNDLHDHAVHDGVLIQAHHLMFPHRHPIVDNSIPMDAAYKEQNNEHAYHTGEILLKWRRRVRFGDAIREAEKIEGWMTTQELTWLSRSASQVENVIEIGSWQGRSTYAICSGTVGNVYAVDHWDWSKVSDQGMSAAYQRAEHGSGSRDVYDQFIHNIVDRFPNALAIRKSSVEAAKVLPNADMVFIDGAHDYESVKADIAAWLPKTKKLICGHDYSDQPEHAGVVQAVQEMLGLVSVVPGTTIWYKYIGSPLIKSLGQPNGKIISWCLPGERFEGPIVSAILKLYGYLLSQGYYVVIHQTWTSSPYVTREVLRLSVNEMVVKPDYVLWTDDDNPVPPEVFDQLLKDLESSPEVGIVAGWTWVDMYDGTFAVSAGIFTEDHKDVKVIPPTQINKETNLIEVEWHGFPVVLMKYDTLVKAGDKPFAGIPAPNSRWGITGEDVAFCTNLKARSDCRLFVDPLAFVRHLKFGSIGPDGRQDRGATVEEMAKI